MSSIYFKTDSFSYPPKRLVLNSAFCSIAFTPCFLFPYYIIDCRKMEGANGTFHKNHHSAPPRLQLFVEKMDSRLLCPNCRTPEVWLVAIAFGKIPLREDGHHVSV